MYFMPLIACTRSAGKGGQGHTNAMHSPRLQSLEQDAEAFLHEMLVVREHIRETFTAHHPQAAPAARPGDQA